MCNTLVSLLHLHVNMLIILLIVIRRSGDLLSILIREAIFVIIVGKISLLYRNLVLSLLFGVLLFFTLKSSNINALNFEAYAQGNRVQLDCIDVAMLLKALDFAIPQFEDDLSGTLDEAAEFAPDFESIRSNIQNVMEDFKAQCDNIDLTFEGAEIQ